MPTARTTTVTALLASGALLTAAFAFGPLDPPGGPVAPTGATLGDIRSDIAGLAAGLGGGPMSLAGMTTLANNDVAFYYLDIPGVMGEALPALARNWTDLVAFGDLGLQRPSSQRGVDTGPQVMQEVTLVIRNGRALQSLLENMVTTGDAIAEMSVRGYRTNDDGNAPQGIRIYTLEMDTVRVLSVQPDTASGASRVTVRARTYTWTYYNQTMAGEEAPLTPVVWNRGPAF